MKIAFIGSHGVGKTTLCYGLAARLKRRDVALEIVHEVARRCPLPINSATTVAAQRWILHTQIAEELVAAARYPVVLCDRSVLDNYVYLLLAAGADPVARPPGRPTGCATYDLLVHVPILGAPQADGIRAADPAFQRAGRRAPATRRSRARGVATAARSTPRAPATGSTRSRPRRPARLASRPARAALARVARASARSASTGRERAERRVAGIEHALEKEAGGRRRRLAPDRNSRPVRGFVRSARASSSRAELAGAHLDQRRRPAGAPSSSRKCDATMRTRMRSPAVDHLAALDHDERRGLLVAASRRSAAKSWRPTEKRAPRAHRADVERAPHPPDEALGERRAAARDLVEVAARGRVCGGRGSVRRPARSASRWMSAGSAR